MWWRRIFRPESGPAGPAAARVPWHFPDLGLPPRALQQLDRLQLGASRFLPGTHAGQRRSLYRQPTWDFREHRMYVPGDDTRFVDWKASARQEQVFVRLGERPKEAVVLLLLDLSASMVWGARPKAAAALELAAALGYLALAHGDRLAVLPFREQPDRPLGPISGKGQFPALLTYLRQLRFAGPTDLLGSVAALRQRSARSGLTVILSDLLGVADLAPVLRLLPAPSWDVIVLHLLDPEEIEPQVHGSLQLVDMESAAQANYDIDAAARQTYRERLARWRQDLELAAIQHHAFYTLVPTAGSLEYDLLPQLRAVQVVVPQ